MSPVEGHPAKSPASLAVYLLGTLDFDFCLALQQRLVYEAGGAQDGGISLLVCEHVPTITVGRQGSRGDIRFSQRTLAAEGLDVRWVNRGGGTLVHGPGQLAVYPIVPLAWHEWTVGEYLQRLQRGLTASLAETGFAPQVHDDRWGLWGRTGQIVATGVAVKNWIAYYGAYVNVSPSRRLLSAVGANGRRQASLSSLAIERQKPAKMTSIRESLVRQLAAAFDCPRFHLHTGHALLTPAHTIHGPSARAS